MSKAHDAERIDRWRVSAVAFYIDKGWITEWPWEITRRGKGELKRRKLDALVEQRVRARLTKPRMARR